MKPSCDGNRGCHPRPVNSLLITKDFPSWGLRGGVKKKKKEMNMEHWLYQNGARRGRERR